MQQQPPESRSPMRQKVRSLTKFQMQRLVSRRAARQNKDRFETAHANPSHQHFEPAAFEAPETTKPQTTLGLPGYRTQPGHTGLDPIESVSEAAFLQGKFIRQLIAGDLRTHDPIILAAMSIGGFLLIVPFVLCLFASMYSGWTMQTIGLTLVLAPIALIGWKLIIAVNVSVRGDHLSSLR